LSLRIRADTADEVAGLRRALAVDLAGGFDHADHVHTLPQRVSRDTGQIGQGAVAPRLYPPMSAFDGLEEVGLHVGVIARIGVDERLLDLGGERLLVAFERKHVVAALRDDLLGDLGLTAHRVDGDDAALEREQLQQGGDGGDLVGLRLGGHLPVSADQKL
jgi:hypothetical protein